mgnify:CR=1 FL=1
MVATRAVFSYSLEPPAMVRCSSSNTPSASDGPHVYVSSRARTSHEPSPTADELDEAMMDEATKKTLMVGEVLETHKELFTNNERITWGSTGDGPAAMVPYQSSSTLSSRSCDYTRMFYRRNPAVIRGS